MLALGGTTAAAPAARPSASASVAPGVAAIAPVPSTIATTPATPPPSSLAPPAQAMSLPDALAFARIHQPALAAAKARIAAAQASVRIPEGQWSPQFGMTAQVFGATANNSTASYLGTPDLDIPRIGATATTYSWSGSTFRPWASTYVGLGVAQELYDFGRIEAQRVAMESFVDVERWRADVDRLDVDLAVREAYFAVQTSRSIIGAANAAYDRAKAHRDLADAQVKAKMWAPIEVTRAEAELTRADVARIRAGGSLAISQTVLAAAIGSTDPGIDAAGEVPEAAGMPPLDKAIADAAARDPVLKQALSMVASQEAQTKAIGAELRPNVLLSATLSARAGGAPGTNGAQPTGYGLLPEVPNWDVGVVFSWPITDGVVSARKEASREKEEAFRAEVDVRKAEEIASVQKAYYAVEIARSALPALQRALDAAKLNYEQADARFKAGLGSAVEVADAETVLAESDIRLAEGKFELARARAIFGRTIAEDL